MDEVIKAAARLRMHIDREMYIRGESKLRGRQLASNEDPVPLAAKAFLLLIGCLGIGASLYGWLNVEGYAPADAIGLTLGASAFLAGLLIVWEDLSRPRRIAREEETLFVGRAADDLLVAIGEQEGIEPTLAQRHLDLLREAVTYLGEHGDYVGGERLAVKVAYLDRLFDNPRGRNGGRA